MELINRKEAKEQGLKFYFTGLFCKRNHLNKRRIDNGGCVECVKIQSKDWHDNNKARHTFLMARRYRENKLAVDAYNMIWQLANKDKTRAAFTRWRKRNLAYDAARSATRKAAKMNRTPSWANLKKIARIYEFARWASKFTDEPLHVDHVIPMQGDTISGLHVENNLQILPATVNCSKHNYWIDDL